MIAAIALQLSTGNKYHSLIFCLSFSNYEIFGKKKKKKIEIIAQNVLQNPSNFSRCFRVF